MTATQNHVCQGVFHVCYYCGKQGCENCMSMVTFPVRDDQGKVKSWQTVWAHHWSEHHCVKKWLELKIPPPR